VSYQVKLRSPAQKELDSVDGRGYEAIAKAIFLLAVYVKLDVHHKSKEYCEEEK